MFVILDRNNNYYDSASREKNFAWAFRLRAAASRHLKLEPDVLFVALAVHLIHFLIQCIGVLGGLYRLTISPSSAPMRSSRSASAASYSARLLGLVGANTGSLAARACHLCRCHQLRLALRSFLRLPLLHCAIFVAVHK